MNNEERLDVPSIIEMEDRVTVLEGGTPEERPSTIYKKELDDLNDRINVLEGKEPEGPKNPMRLAELKAFDERIDTLEEEESDSVVEFPNGTKIVFELEDFCTALKEKLSADDLNKLIDRSEESIFLKIKGPSENDTVEFEFTDVMPRQFKISNTNNGTTGFIAHGTCDCDNGAHLYEVLFDLAKPEFDENYYIYNATKLTLYEKPHVEIIFEDGTTKEVKLDSAVLPLTVLDLDNPKVFEKERDIIYNSSFDDLLKAYQPDYEDLGVTDALHKISFDKNTGSPFLFILGPDSNVTLSNGVPVVTGDASISIGVGEDDAQDSGVYLIEDWDGTVASYSAYTKHLLGHYSSGGDTIPHILSFGLIPSEEEVIQLVNDAVMFNPVKLVYVLEQCDALQLAVIDVNFSDANKFPIKYYTEE